MEERSTEENYGVGKSIYQESISPSPGARGMREWGFVRSRESSERASTVSILLYLRDARAATRLFFVWVWPRARFVLTDFERPGQVILMIDREICRFSFSLIAHIG